MTSKEDSDLDDLLGENGEASMEEQTPLNLDNLSEGKLDVAPTPKPSGGGGDVVNFASAFMTYMCYSYPMLCTCLSFLAVMIGMLAVANVLFNPTETFGEIDPMYSNIQSKYDLSVTKVKHWCLQGDDTSCRCSDPLEPMSRMSFKSWTTAHNENKKSVLNYQDSELLDVAFLGGSLVEEMDGRWMGMAQKTDLEVIDKIFRKHFKRSEGSSGMEGVALGIAGDSSPNVLWRLNHGEMPDDFNPRVWWVTLGMNDLARLQCSEEVVVLGVLRVVEEIMTRKPDAIIVINSLLPMTDLRGGVNPHFADYKDGMQSNLGRARSTDRGNIVPPNKKNFETAVDYKRPKATTDAIHERLKLRKKALQDGAFSINAKNYPAKNGGGSKHKQTTKEKLGKRMADGEKVYNGNRDLKKGKKAEDAEEGGEGEETPAEKKFESKYLKKARKDPKNPVMNLKDTHMKKRDPKALFMKSNEKRMPLWTSIHSINKVLRDFTEGQGNNVHFFDATSIFTEKDGSKYVLDTDLISVRGHPSHDGFNKWQESIANRLKKILVKEDEELEVELKAIKANEKDPLEAAAGDAGADDAEN